MALALVQPESEPVAPGSPAPKRVRKGKKPEPGPIIDLLQQARRVRIQHEAVWRRNKLFVRGDQWLDYDDINGMPIDRRVPAWKKFTTLNVVYNHRRVLVSKRTAIDHVPIIIPVTSEETDRAKARASEQIIKWVFRENDYEQERVYNAIDAVETGSSFYRIDWDAKAGTQLQLDDASIAALVANGTSAEEAADQYTGMPRFRNVSPLEVYVSPGAMRLQDARWLLHVQWVSIDYVLERWGVEVTPGDQVGAEDLLQQRTPLDPDTLRQAEDFVSIIECWRRPSKDHPKGYYAVVCNDTVIDWRGELEPWGFPFVYMPLDPDPDAFYGTTPLSNVCQIQRDLNRLVAAMLEGANHSMFPPVMVPNGSNLQMPTGDPGEHLSYNETAGRPWVMDTRSIDPQVFQITALLNTAINMVSGVSEATLGEVSSSTSGRAIAFAAEKDEVKLAASHKVYKSGVKQLVVLLLRFVQHYGQGRAILPVLGENGASDLDDFEINEISFRDVEIFVDESMPHDPAAKREQALAFLQAGAITKEQFSKILDFGRDSMSSMQDPIKQRANHENKMLYQQDVQVMPHEDDAVHLVCHSDEMNQARWYDAPEEVKIRFISHIMQHAAKMQGMAMGDQGQTPGADSAGQGAAPSPTLPPEPGAVPIGPSEQAGMQAINPTRTA